MNRVPYPWTSVEAAQEGSRVDVRVWGRRMRQEGSLFPISLKTQGSEMLYAPIRLVGQANGEPILWEDEGCYLLEPTKEKAVVNGYAQSQCLIANSTLQWEYDGGARWDVKLMPRGLTVPQVFGLEECPVKAWQIEKLHLEIPLRKDAASLYVSWPRGGVQALSTAEPLAENGTIPAGGLAMPFKPGLLLGTENIALQWTCESDELWQSADRARAIELADGGDHWVLRLRLLDSPPRTWDQPGVDSPHLNFTFGLMLTPVKPVDPEFLKLRAVHIDCFAKIEGDYWPYLNSPMPTDSPEKTDGQECADDASAPANPPELVIDRLTRAGVNLLILHEKWNKIQNYWEYAVTTKDEIARLVRLCHSRGIRVIPYFGYEITSPMPRFAQVQRDVTWIEEGRHDSYSGWYRVPYQRAHKVCYQSEWRGELVNGILKCLDDFDFDGVYLDTTTAPFGCVNQRHGCGYRDEAGQVRPTYPIFATREMMMRICEGVHARHGLVNPHPSGATFPMITSAADFLWDGEHIQTDIWRKGLTSFSLDYFRAEYLGRNLGIPVQFIVYEAKGLWSFDMALSVSLIHGVYPRPNSVLHPLDVMEEIWRIADTYEIADAAFHGYWENTAAWRCDRDEIKVSFYARPQLDQTLRLLVYAANPTVTDCGSAMLTLIPEALGMKTICSIYDARSQTALPAGDISLSARPYGLEIFEILLSK